MNVKPTNKEIFTILHGAIPSLRKADCSLHVQTTLAKSSYSMMKFADDLAKAEKGDQSVDEEDTIKSVLEAVTLNTLALQHMDLLRRDKFLTVLPHNMKSLAERPKGSHEQLFGDIFGFFISEKSVLSPTKQLIFLGFVLDSEAMTITLTDKRKGKILSAAKVMASTPMQRIRAVAALVGMIIAALPGVKHGQLHYRRLERDKNLALLHTKENYNKNMTLSAGAVQDAIWWYTTLPVSYSFIHPPIISHYLYTDASLAGWGATDSQVTAGGAWDEDEPPANINVLELRAAHLALQSLCKHCVGSHVCLYMDNSTAVSYINKKRGTHSVLCDALAVEIWQWAIPQNIWLSAAFIPGESNVVADFYSRCPNDNNEWQLNPKCLNDCVRL